MIDIKDLGWLIFKSLDNGWFDEIDDIIIFGSYLLLNFNI